MSKDDVTRREFVKGAAAIAAMTMIGPLIRTAAGQPSRYRIKVGVIGCGGRGTGAAINALEASKDTEIHALADVFQDRLNSCRQSLESRTDEIGERIMLRDANCFSGFDAYKQLLETDVDVVILTSPPHFRPVHMTEAIARGKHVFAEKPVAVDPVGVRRVLAAADEADRKNLSIVVGTQRRYETCYLETMQKIRDGTIGKIIAASCYWNQGGLWMVERKPEWSDMEWQLRNWLYFTWLSGDHIVEQHMHNIDVINWALNAHPVRCTGMGGRQVRTGSNYGNVFDHFTVEYEYENGVSMTSMCRQIDGCSGRVEEVLRGSEGVCSMSMGWARIEGANPWRFAGQDNNPYVEEHAQLFKAITTGNPINAARAAAESTLTAIMGRMSAYTGKTVTWGQAMNSTLDLSPPTYEFGDLPIGEVAVPGRTPLI